MTFRLNASFRPCGDQPQAIEQLIQGIRSGRRSQVLQGITGSGKTFTIANVIQELNRPALIIAHNKTLAAQLYQEFHSFFPDNAIEYFVSYYDYYQPEAYIARTDTYIEKSLLINDEIDKLRLSATRSLAERRDVIVIASVSCIYGIGSPENYLNMTLNLRAAEIYSKDHVALQLLQMHYAAVESHLFRGSFRIRGHVIDIFPAYESNFAVRLEFKDVVLKQILTFDPNHGSTFSALDEITIYPGSHYVSSEDVRLRAIESIEAELQEHLSTFKDRPLERERLFNRTRYDMEMIKEIGFCKGIENYSRHFSNSPPGMPPKCLLDYFPEDYLLIIDESHQTLPQMRAMYHGDRARKETLVNFGFRLPSAFDNRPLKFEEAYRFFRQVIYVSATPGNNELHEVEHKVIEQVIRPMGIPDPLIEIRPASGQMNDIVEEIRKRSNKNERILIISLTKKLAEEIAAFLEKIGIKARYLHSDINIPERTRILSELRSGVFNVLIGVNLLREGLDLPEVSLVAILDADKEGFLRSSSSLIQICGRAARNIEGTVIMYADGITASMQKTVEETERRRILQLAYNSKYDITPKTVIKDIHPELLPSNGIAKSHRHNRNKRPACQEEMAPPDKLTLKELTLRIKKYDNLMKKAAKEYRFQEATDYRNLLDKYKAEQLRRKS
ncbi:MAG: excinuclease ABC subunit UvrB [Victivallaceae bacterium]